MGYPIWNRRRFLKTAAGTAGFLAVMPCLNAEEALTNTKPLKVGLVGCGGRGLGAMKNALDADPGTIAWALADVFQERIDFGAKLLAEQYGNRARLDRSRLFSGLDSYKRLLQTDIDVVLLCTPPAFRPEHLAVAIDASKHIYAEKTRGGGRSRRAFRTGIRTAGKTQKSGDSGRLLLALRQGE
ncbi:Gfo/Idh/MocA family oxidoreductase [Akkermansia muciniphila]|uniref:Gfo/Idh/MocA family oxidoreductase n=1 Tax=Akkermansia muciniphila TaxID=239935 RepID=UPI001C05EEBB|nr:Gfo/Idh/MocA family oxidoreductase [Akkermansia muciniphila]